MSRSIKKSPFYAGTKSCSLIFPFCVGRTYKIHNGKSYIPIKVTEQMVGHYFGEFIRSRRFPNFSKFSKRKR